MDQLLGFLFSFSFMIFCLGIAGISFVIRRMVEFLILDHPKVPTDRKNSWWRELILPILPVVIGGVLAFLAPEYPYPEALGVAVLGRVFFGVVAGLFSGLVYRVIIGLLKGKNGKTQ